MGSSSDDFNGLQRLLKLKRYEQPPSRHFDSLSSGVHSRLRGPEGLRQETMVRVLGLEFGIKPILYFGLGLLCCGLTVYGVTCLMTKTPRASGDTPPLAGSPVAEAPAFTGRSAEPILAPEPAGGGPGASTNPVLSPVGRGVTLDPTKLRPTPVSYPKK